MPPGVPEQLEALFGGQYVEAFGATEASAFVCSNRPAARRIGSVGRPMPGVTLRVVKSDGAPAAPGEDGELPACGPGIFSGYDKDPAAALAVDDGWFRTGDLGRVDADGYVFVTGRIKEQINRGGSKLPPGEVEATRLKHEAVARCAVFAVPDERLGQEVAAVVVTHAGRTVGELELRRHAATLLADYKVPRRVVFRDSIPASAVGMVQRLSPAATVGLTVAAETTAAATPATPLEQAVAAVWAHVLGWPVRDVNASFFTLGGDSVQASDVCLRNEKRFGVSLPLAGLSTRPAVRRLAAVLEADGYRPTPGAPVVVRDGRLGGPTLFVLPGIGGNCFGFHGLATPLPAPWRVVGLPLPGPTDWSRRCIA